MSPTTRTELNCHVSDFHSPRLHTSPSSPAGPINARKPRHIFLACAPRFDMPTLQLARVCLRGWRRTASSQTWTPFRAAGGSSTLQWRKSRRHRSNPVQVGVPDLPSRDEWYGKPAGSKAVTKAGQGWWEELCVESSVPISLISEISPASISTRRSTKPG